MGMLQKIEARQAVPFDYADADFSAPVRVQGGETPFAAGDIFLAEAIGEYELSGACEFIAVRL